MIWTWGVNDAGQFSGNIRKSYRSLSSYSRSVPDIQTGNNKGITIQKFTRNQLKEMATNVQVTYKE